MQTFLPYPDFKKSAECLDMKRLGKQRVEVLQLLKGGWPNHPCAKMWKDHHEALALYGIIVCQQWKSLGYKDTCEEKIRALFPNLADEWIHIPDWIGLDRPIHLSHQSNLIRKKPEFYKPIFGEDIPDNLPYIWPI